MRVNSGTICNLLNWEISFLWKEIMDIGGKMKLRRKLTTGLVVIATHCPLNFRMQLFMHAPNNSDEFVVQALFFVL